MFSALKNYEVPTAVFPMLISDFIASTAYVLQLLLPTVSGRLTGILDAEGSVAGEVEVLENMPEDTPVYYKPRNRRGASAIAIKRKRLGPDKRSRVC